MIVLDTNVISEAMRPEPEPRALAWLDERDPRDLYLTAVTVGELAYGVARLPEGRRRDAVADLLDQHLSVTFRGRVLPYDAAAARICGALVAARERSGRPISAADAQIASIASAHGATLATRNVRDFDATGVAVVNPWEPT